MEMVNITENLDKNEEFLRNTIGQSSDTNYRRFNITAFNNKTALLVNISGLADANLINDFLLTPLMSLKQLPTEINIQDKAKPITWLVNSGISLSNVRESNQWTDICNSIMSGDSVLFLQDCDTAIILSTKGWESRTIKEPNTESEPRGPKDGFIEDIESNTSLIRRRIKDNNLRFENMIIGERTKTNVMLAYIDDLVNKSILQEARTRLSAIKIDGILETGYIEELITDSPNSVFPLIQRTERPDKACSAILEGRIIILVDTTPFVLIIPSVFLQFINASGDYYEKSILSSFIRCIRLLALFMSLSLSSFYVLLMSFHQEMIPTSLALKLASSRQGLPLPATVETFAMELVFEILKEAGIRMPSSIGQTVSFIGALVIGEAAVSAGFIGPATVIVIALAAICSFVIPSLSMSNSIRFIRFPLLILSSSFGLFGFLGGIIVIILHLLSLRCFSVPYLAPISPFDKNANKDVIIRAPLWRMEKRPSISKPSDPMRQKNDSKPEPPKEK